MVILHFILTVFWFLTPEGAQSASPGFYFDLFFGLEDGGDVFPKRRAISELHDVTTKKARLL
jgi:hypothetical protein